jgi:Fe-S cluster assembly protein SufD
VPAFTPDAARQLTGPWTERRTAAAERVAAAVLPTPDEEIWRYSRITELDLDRFAPTPTVTRVTGGDGLVAGAEDASGDPELASLVDVVGGEAPDVFADLNLAFMAPTIVRVPPGRVVAEPIVVTHTIAGDGAAHFPRLVIDAGPDSEVTVVERFVTPNGDRALVVPVLQLRAAPAARVKYLGVNELGPAVWQIAHQQAVGERDSTTLLATVALGGDYARVRTDARLVGQGGSTRQVALYFAGDTQMHDFRTLQDHAAPKTHSDLLFKGAVQDTAKSVYTGLIRIRHDAKGSQAFQTNRNLTLSEGAWAESVPNLEIETNDVKCSHASTVGPIDPEQRFYLESRGLQPHIAERLVVLGFFDEVLAQLPAGDLAAELRSRVSAKLHLDSEQEVAA